MGQLNLPCLFGYHKWYMFCNLPFGRRMCARCGGEQERRYLKWFSAWKWRWIRQGPRK